MFSLLPVLLLSSALMAQESPPVVVQSEVDAAIDRGAAWLLEQVNPAANKGWVGGVGHMALIWYTLLEAGVPSDHPRVVHLRNSLRPEFFGQTYATACWMLAMAKEDPIRHFALLRDAAHQMLEWQENDGDWGYPDNPDLSNTQFAALGLWKAAQVGVVVPSWAWQKLATGVLRYRCADHGFSYRPNGSATASMTAAGVGTLAICEQQLLVAGVADPDLYEEIREARRGGLEWLAEAYEVGRQIRFRSGSFQGYTLYGIERLGAFLGIEWIGKTAWYPVGAKQILEAQADDGSWSRNPVDSCFAILFLKRATSMDRPGVAFTGGSTARIPDGDPGSAVCWLRAEGHGPVRIGVDHWRWPALRAFESRGERGKGPRIERVDYFVDGKLFLVQLADGERPMANARYRVDLWIPTAGSHRVQARFHVRTAQRGPAVVLESVPLDIRVVRALPEHFSQFDGAYGRNLLATVGTRIRASSVHTGGKGLPRVRYAAARCLDGRVETSWFARESDHKPSLTLRLTEECLAGALVIHPPQAKGLKIEQLGLPQVLRITLDDGSEHALVVPDDGPAVLDFDPPRKVSKIQIEVIHTRPGSVSAVPGFGEITLHGPLR